MTERLLGVVEEADLGFEVLAGALFTGVVELDAVGFETGLVERIVEELADALLEVVVDADGLLGVAFEGRGLAAELETREIEVGTAVEVEAFEGVVTGTVAFLIAGDEVDVGLEVADVLKGVTAEEPEAVGLAFATEPVVAVLEDEVEGAFTVVPTFLEGVEAVPFLIDFPSTPPLFELGIEGLDFSGVELDSLFLERLGVLALA